MFPFRLDVNEVKEKRKKLKKMRYMRTTRMRRWERLAVGDDKIPQYCVEKDLAVDGGKSSISGIPLSKV